MPEWLDEIYEKVLAPLFGSAYKGPDVEPHFGVKGRDQEGVAMETFRRRASTSSAKASQRAPGFDYVHWKPYGKKRHRYYPDEYVRSCISLSPWVSATAYAGYVGLEERRWAGAGLEPLPIGVRGPMSMPGSLQSSRDILSKMGPGPQV